MTGIEFSDAVDINTTYIRPKPFSQVIIISKKLNDSEFLDLLRHDA